MQEPRLQACSHVGPATCLLASLFSGSSSTAGKAPLHGTDTQPPGLRSWRLDQQLPDPPTHQEVLRGRVSMKPR